MNNKAGDASSDLDIMGANNVIGGPIAGKIYIVSKKTKNTAKPIATNSYHETARGFPAAPNDVTISVEYKSLIA